MRDSSNIDDFVPRALWNFTNLTLVSIPRFVFKLSTQIVDVEPEKGKQRSYFNVSWDVVKNNAT